MAKKTGKIPSRVLHIRVPDYIILACVHVVHRERSNIEQVNSNPAMSACVNSVLQGLVLDMMNDLEESEKRFITTKPDDRLNKIFNIVEPIEMGGKRKLKADIDFSVFLPDENEDESENQEEFLRQFKPSLDGYETDDENKNLGMEGFEEADKDELVKYFEDVKEKEEIARMSAADLLAEDDYDNDDELTKWEEEQINSDKKPWELDGIISFDEIAKKFPRDKAVLGVTLIDEPKVKTLSGEDKVKHDKELELRKASIAIVYSAVPQEAWGSDAVIKAIENTMESLRVQYFS